METGQKIIQPKINIDELSSYILSIQVSLNGLSFCILNQDNITVTYYRADDFKKRLNPSELLNEVDGIFNSDKALQNSYKAVTVIYDNELSVLVPKSLFDEDHLADYLKFNSRILQNDFLSYDTIAINDSICVYVPYMNINNYLYEMFGTFEYKHFSSVLIESILSLEKNMASEKMYVHVGSHHFEIMVIDNNDLKLFNTFEYNTKEDFIYYILFTAEQLQLNPEEFELILLGKVAQDDDLYNIVFTYVRHVNVLKTLTKFSIGENVNSKIHQNFLLLNSL